MAAIARPAFGLQYDPVKSQTARRPGGQSYILKASQLEAALASAGLAIDTHLVRSPGALLDAHFWPPNRNVPYERLYVRAGSVPTSQAAEARRQIQTVTIPALVKWLTDILGCDPDSPVRREEQAIGFRLS